MPRIIPFAPMPLPVLRAITAPLMRYSTNTDKFFPGLKYALKQSELGLDTQEYGAIMIFIVLFYTVFFGVLITLMLSKMMEHFAVVGITVGLVMGLLMFFQVMMYPTMIVRKKTRSIDKNLVFALRAILVQLKSGVSLFEAMTMVARGQYGTVSKEFKKAVDSINTGTPEQEALEIMSENNPSPYLRKSLWQIVNGMNAGADISAVLGETVSSMIREQKLAITRYGSQLRVLSLMYMMIGVIMPALGVTLLIVLFTFPMVGEAVERTPALKGITGMMQAVIPGETYAEGDFITGLGGRGPQIGENLKIRIDELDGKRGVFTLMNEEDEEIMTQPTYGEDTNLKDYFITKKGIRMFGESLKVKSFGTNLFGQDQVEVTRLEQTHLLFWGLLALVSVMQFMYIGIIKSRRPGIIG